VEKVEAGSILLLEDVGRLSLIKDVVKDNHLRECGVG
jgi:hypothetical protein